MSSSPLPLSLQNLKPEIIQRFRDILTVPLAFDSPEEQTGCETAVDQLSSEEVEDIATISYAYWALHKLQDEFATTDIAKKVATKITRWHLQHLGPRHVNDHEAVIKRLRDVIQIRKERKLELFRTCFDIDCRTNNDNKNELLSDEIVEIQKSIYDDMEKQSQFLRGNDKDGHPILIKIPRIAPGTTEFGYTNQQLYVAEKAVAVTEYISCGKNEKICAIFSMKNQNSSYTPSLSWQLHCVNLLQQLYPGRIGLIIVLDAPFLIRGIFNTIKPFLSTSIRESTFLLAGSSGTKKLEEIMTAEDDYRIFDADTGELTHPIDIDKYFYDTPFYCPYDYNDNKDL